MPNDMTAGLGTRFPIVVAPVIIGDRTWQVAAVQNQDALVDSISDLENMPYGFLLWESAIGLARHLWANRADLTGKTVLEIGCGVGLPGIVARALGASVSQTDHQPGVLKLARQNAAANEVLGIEQFLADWRDWQHTERYDLIIGADIMYEREMHFFLDLIFKQNLKAGGTLIVSDPGRRQSIELMSQMENRGWRFDVATTPVRLDHEGADAKLVDVVIASGQHK